MRISLILITWNELEGCKHDIPLIDRSKFDEIFCIDGGSTDGTVSILRNRVFLYSDRVPRVLIRPAKMAVITAPRMLLCSIIPREPFPWRILTGSEITMSRAMSLW